MIDIHSHILPGIDDGSKSFEESMELIRSASSNGVTDIIATPHYIVGSDYMVNNEEKRKLLTKLKKQVQKEEIPINLYLGNEVFVENNMLELRKKKEITTLHNSKYLLFELPLNYKYNGIENLLFELGCKGIIPIIAHPERYAFLKENPSLAIKLIDAGALFQSNIGSFLGIYGKKAEETAILLLKHHAITFVSSDIHHKNKDFYELINKAKKVMRKYVSEEEINLLFEKNAEKILNKKEIKGTKCIPFKKNIFGKWK